jgi:hypothetical protein
MELPTLLFPEWFGSIEPPVCGALPGDIKLLDPDAGSLFLLLPFELAVLTEVVR